VYLPLGRVGLGVVGVDRDADVVQLDPALA